MMKPARSAAEFIYALPGRSSALRGKPLPLRPEHPVPVEPEMLERLARRVGLPHLEQRLRLEGIHERRKRAGGLKLYLSENWYSSPRMIRAVLKSTGLYRRASANAARVEIVENTVHSGKLPEAFDGFTILHVSDLHIDLNAGAMHALAELLPRLNYDACVLTGDFRGRTYGPFAAALDGLARLFRTCEAPVYGVLGNHDSILMVPALEEMGIRMLLNESEPIVRGSQSIHLAGIDDAHSYRLDDIEKAAGGIPDSAFSVLLSHTPEVYRQAAGAGFDLMLSGHTHGGQLCLPGGIPVTLDSVLPRRMGAGSWAHRGMAGYTSVGVGSSVEPVRLNCPAAVALHRLRRV